MLPVYCFVSDKDLWTLQAFAWFFNRYWSSVWPVMCFGYTPPEFVLPPNFSFVSVGDFADYPVNRWSDGVIKALQSVTDELFIYMMGDFWPYRKVNTEAINMLSQFMAQHPEIARIDLTTDRLYAAGLREAGSVAYLDLITNDLPVPYLLSLQPGLWRREALLRYLIPGETGWETEINGTSRMQMNGEHPAVVLGTRQAPVRVLIAIQKGKLTLDGGYQIPPPPVRQEDLQTIRELGYLP